ncbi:hypothetical protein C0992_008230 [Termitomyces sp. T32_za158]|nr:hypothetical protein C0992_008230 [Termitomyces sp. T32_za158]
MAPGIELDDVSGPSKRVTVYNDEDGDTGSDFAPETDRDAEGDEEDDENDDENEDGNEDSVAQGAPIAQASLSVTNSRRSTSILETKAQTIRSVLYCPL